MGFPSVFPGALDSFPTNYVADQVLGSAAINGALDAINKIQAAIGGTRRSFAYYTGHTWPQLSDYHTHLQNAAADLGTRGGLLELPAGDWPTLYLVNWRTNVGIVGQGRGVSRIVSHTTAVANDTIRAGYIGSAQLANLHLAHLSIVAPVNVDYAGALRMCAANVTLDDVELVGGHYGLVFEGYNPTTPSSVLQFRDLYIHGQRMQANGNSLGSGLWVFGPVHHVTGSGLIVDDIDGGPIVLDYGHAPAGGPVTDVEINGALLSNYGQAVTNASNTAAVDFEGAVRCTVRGRVFGGATINPNAHGVVFSQDQSGVTADDNLAELDLVNVGGHAVQVGGGNRNLARLKVRNVGMGGQARQMVAISDNSQNAITGDATDNVLEVYGTQAAGIGSNSYAVLINRGSGGLVQRNLIAGRLHPGSSGGLLVTGSPTMSGADANTVPALS